MVCVPQRLTAMRSGGLKESGERLFFGTLESRTKKAAEKIKVNSAEVRV